MDALTWLRAQWDRVLGFALVAIGAIALAVAYEKAASTRYLAEQITVLISGGLGGIFCLGAGATLLVCADIRDEWRKLDRIEGVLLEIRDELALPRIAEGAPPERSGPESTVPDGSRTEQGSARAGAEPSRLAGRALAAPGGNPKEEGSAPRRAEPSRLVGRAVTLPVVVLGLIGLAITIAGWETSASTTRGSTALDAAAWSAAGLVLAGLGSVVLIVALKRSVRLREVAILTPVALEGARRAAGRGPDATTATDGQVYYSAGLHHFHRPGCAALANLQADACDRAAAAPRLAPCPLCEP